VEEVQVPHLQFLVQTAAIQYLALLHLLVAEAEDIMELKLVMVVQAEEQILGPLVLEHLDKETMVMEVLLVVEVVVVEAVLAAQELILVQAQAVQVVRELLQQLVELL
jgi:hypothetical protein